MFKKRAYSVFYETDLNLLLRSLGVGTVILTGLIPIYTLGIRLLMRFQAYRIIVIRMLWTCLRKRRMWRVFDYLRRVYGAEIMISDEVINLLRSGKSAVVIQ